MSDSVLYNHVVYSIAGGDCGIWVAKPRSSGEAPARTGLRVVTDRPIRRESAILCGCDYYCCGW